MVITTRGIYGNDETEKVLFKINGGKTALSIIKDYYGLRDDELKNSKRLKQLGVKWLPRIGEIGCSEEQFNILFGDVIDYDTKGDATKIDDTSVAGTETDTSVGSTKKRTRKSA